MRLLSLNAEGTFSLTTFVRQLPSYAILSHTWYSNDEEYTFQDLKNGTGSGKDGFKKSQFCGAQAQKDGLKYFWVDSCCIDKSNSTELQEAINSMFRWYQNAARCYVYLTDVSVIGCTQSQWKSAFMRSRWFTRGWTLQELLAPKSVEFFSHNGERLGDKDSLEQQIHEVTGIQVEALQGTPLSQFSTDARMSWTAKRDTMIEEDQVYCLLGIFEIYLPLIYGEGKKHAWRRLQDEIERRSSLKTQEMKLETADRKQHVDTFLQLLRNNACSYEDSKNRNRERVPGTCNWFTNHELFKKWNTSTKNQLEPSTLLFVTADPGCGKSVLSRYLVDEVLPKDARIVCYFFFKDDFEDQKNSLQALCTLLHQLLSSNRHLVSDAMLQQHGGHGDKLVNSFDNLWSIFIGAASNQETLCILDALDECLESDRQQLIEAVIKTFDQKSRNLKFLMTSRPYEHIRRRFDRKLGSLMSSIHLQGDHGPTADAIVKEIQMVVDSRIKEAGKEFCLEPEELKLLKEQFDSVPNRTYLWVTLVFDDLMESTLGIDKHDILEMTRVLPKSVYDTYEKILKRNPNLEKLRRRALHIILAAKRPISLAEMSEALAFTTEDNQPTCGFSANKIVPLSRMRAHLRDLCGLFVAIVDDKIYLLHQTAREFLISNTKEVYTIQKNCKLPANLQNEWRHSMNLQDSNSYLTQICLSRIYLNTNEPSSAPLDDSAFLEYAAHHWPDHYHQSREIYQDLATQITLDLCCSPQLRTRWTIFHETEYEIPTGGPSMALMSALGLGKALKTFLSKQTDTEEIDAEIRSADSKMTPLMWAARNGHEIVVSLLIEARAGGDIEETDQSGCTPLRLACEKGNLAVIKLLRDFGADINARDEKDRTPLWAAVEFQHADVVQFLADAGADVNAKNRRSQTPLLVAAERGYLKMVDLLLSLGADSEVKDAVGQTPLMLAAGEGNESVIKSLLAAGANVQARDFHGWTPLFYVITDDNEAATTLLLEAGADIDVVDNEGRSPLWWAAQKGHKGNVDLILKSPP